MFGIGGGEIILILVIALIFLGPDKLPEAAKQISKGIRDLKKHGRVLQRTIEDDEHIGGAIRDLKSAMRGDDIPSASPKPPLRRKKRKKKIVIEGAAVAAALPAGEGAGPIEATAEPIAEKVAEPEVAKPAITLPLAAGERDDDDAPRPSAEQAAAETAELAAMIRPAAGTIAKSSLAANVAAVAVKPEPDHG